MSKSWSYLKKNDVVDIIAPASHSPGQKLEEGLEWLEGLGLRPRVPHNLITPDVFFAAPLEVQLEHLKAALYSDSKAIWCVRGGYGSMRLVPHLAKLKPPRRPKLFIGFSDITALHLFFTQEWNWPVIHGRTISQLKNELQNTPDRRFLKQMIFGQKTERAFKNLRPLNEVAKKKNTLEGKLTGGNLRILQSSLKTKWELQTKGKILFMEDVGERGYSVDRMLEQMIQGNLLGEGVKAVIFGGFDEGEEKDGRDLVPHALRRFAEKVPYPVLSGLPAGHGKINYPIPFNTPAVLNLGPRGELICAYGGASGILS